jgi:hypothetical protein
MITFRRCILLLFAFRISTTLLSAAGPEPFSLRVLPDERVFPRIHASGLAHQTGIAKDLSSRRWFGDIGGERPLLEFTVGDIDIQAGLGATVHAGILRKPPLLQVVTVDFVVDFPIDIRITPALSIRTGYGHFSAHIADDGIEVLGIRSINYAKDYVSLLGAYRFTTADGVIYAGGRYDFHSLPEAGKYWVGQIGGEAHPVRLFEGATVYAAVDLRIKEETAWRSTQSYQVGVAFAGQTDASVRVAYTYRTGGDDRGQFYTQTSSAHLFGLFIDL